MKSFFPYWVKPTAYTVGALFATVFLLAWASSARYSYDTYPRNGREAVYRMHDANTRAVARERYERGF